MTKAKKLTNIPAPQTDDEAADYIEFVGQYQRTLRSLSDDLKVATAKPKKEYEEKAEPLKIQLKEKLDGLEKYCAAHRDRLTEGGKRKFFDFKTGRVLWRLRPASVTLRGINAVIEACKNLGLTKFVRTREEINKEAMLENPQEASSINGVNISSSGEDFSVEPAGEHLKDVS